MTDSKESKGGAIPSQAGALGYKSADSFKLPVCVAQIRQWVITEYPVGTPTDKNVKLETVSLDLDKSFGKGDVLVKVLCMSVDPYQRQVLGPRVSLPTVAACAFAAWRVDTAVLLIGYPSLAHSGVRRGQPDRQRGARRGRGHRAPEQRAGLRRGRRRPRRVRLAR